MFVDLEFKGMSIGTKNGGNIEGWESLEPKHLKNLIMLYSA